MRRPGLLLVGLLAVAVTGEGIIAGTAAQTETVVPIAAARCAAIRASLERTVPIGPGVRQREIDFPVNEMGIGGRLCRLLAVGTGVHIEGERIRTLADMAAYIRQALERVGFRENRETKPFTARGQPGRHVFALYRDGALCVSTVQVGLVEGANPPPGAVEGGAIHLGVLRPHEREWWVAVDCFRA